MSDVLEGVITPEQGKAKLEKAKAQKPDFSSVTEMRTKETTMAKNTKIKTPIGELRWVFITGDGRDQSDNNDGSKMQKMASLVLKTESEACEKLKADINAVWEEYKAANPTKIKKATQPKSLGYKVVKDPDTDEETDETIFAFKTNSFFPDGKPNKIPVYNAKGQKVDLGDTIVGNGSRGIIFGEAAGYEYAKQYGVSLYLKGIQIAKLVEGGSADIDAEDISNEGDFEAPEDGNIPEVDANERPEV